MSGVAGLVLPFFGLIFIGYAVARLKPHPADALGWMNTFVIYVALPALFFQLLAKTPIEKLTEWGYIFGAVASTYIVFAIMFVGSMLISRSSVAESTIKGLAAAYGNIGYMGPGLALLAFGEKAAVPVALACRRPKSPSSSRPQWALQRLRCSSPRRFRSNAFWPILPRLPHPARSLRWVSALPCGRYGAFRMRWASSPSSSSFCTPSSVT